MKITKDFDYQSDIFRQFCQGTHFEMSLGNRYACDGILATSLIDNNIRSRYDLLWNDFVSIQVNLIDGKLRQLFEKTLNVSKIKINEFYNKYFHRFRTCCLMLPFNGHDHDNTLICKIIGNKDEWFEMTNKFNNTTEIEKNNNTNEMNIYKYIVIWNGIFNMLNRYNCNLKGCGLGFEIYRQLFQNKDSKNDSKKDDDNDNNNNEEKEKEKEKDGDFGTKLYQLCCNYICDELSQTNMFGNYVNFHEYDQPSNKVKQDILANNKNACNLCKKMLFDNNFDELNRLIQYCLKNISDINSYNNIKVINQYEATGIVGFIVNEMAYVIFHDLTMNFLNNNNNNNNNNNTNDLLFPKLLKMSKFIYNFSCYNYCYPFADNKESFYICQYFDLRNTVYKNIFSKQETASTTGTTDNTDTIDTTNTMTTNKKASKINHFNYYCGSDCDGTVLHASGRRKYRQYCELLVKDGSDMNEANRLNGNYNKTSLQLAKRSRDKTILVVLESLSKSAEAGSGEEVSNMKSLYDEADVLFKQIMFSKYFLLCLGINVNDDVDIKSSQEILTYLGGGVKKKVRYYMNDELYYRLGKLTSGLSIVGDDDVKNGLNIINGIISVVMKLIETKMIIQDELVILSWIYCNYCSRSGSNSDIKNKFLDSLIYCVEECLSSSKTEYKIRNYLYFKQFLLHSNIWYCNDISNDNNNNSNKLLFEYVDNLTDKLLIEQKNYIKTSIENEEKQDKENWDKLCHFNKYNKSNVQFRQDRIKNGIKSFKSIKDAYSIATKMSNPEYNVLSEFNDKVYLTQCLTFANENNKYFQNEMKKWFSKKTRGLMKEAPVKLYDRCLVKSS